ncbi:hypothetical protein VEE10_25410 [Escherichia coli]|nr:hypothetical protein VEE10_25410 [Escherichia coli]
MVPETKNSVAQFMKKSLRLSGNNIVIMLNKKITLIIDNDNVFINLNEFILNIRIMIDRKIPIRDERAETNADKKIIINKI